MAAVSDDFWANGLPVLESRRVRLRPMVVADAPALIPIYGDPIVAQWGFAPPVATLEDAQALVLSCGRLVQARTLFHWGLSLVEDDVIVGHSTLFQMDLKNRRAEVGYSLRRDLWGRGIVTEALDLLIDLAFGPLDLRRLEADVDPRNLGSLRVLEKVGFQREGLLRERWETEAGVDDTVILGLLRRERSRRAPA